MLNLGFDIDVDIKKVHCPFHFEKVNECVHCGGKDTLIFIDKFGHQSRKEINAFDHIKCTKCGHSYSMKWEPDENGDMKPSAVELDIKRQFNNLLYAKIGNKSFQ
jgi:hypothetical protein